MCTGVNSIRVHYIGIGGISMSALAQIDLLHGRTVSGSDMQSTEMTRRLQTMGAIVFQRHSAENVKRAAPDIVVYTDAVHADNPELVEARRMGAEVVRRADYLGRLMDAFTGPRIGIAGTHGKTTTTAMVAETLVEAGLDPTVLVGGEYAPFGGNLRLGAGSAFVTEACEAFRSFHALRPDIAVVTNVEPDHLDCYGTVEGVVDGFVTFARGMRAGGTLVIGGLGEREARVAEAARRQGTRVLRYSLASGADVDLWAEGLQYAGGTSSFIIRTKEEPDRQWNVELNVPGEHNVLNAMAAVGVALAVGVPLETAVAGLRRFNGVGRRFERLGVRDGVVVVDDYAHHPTEINATLRAARAAFPGQRIIAVFQPHLYSRTRDFLQEFAHVLSGVDCLVLTDIYAAREEPIEGVDITALADAVSAMTPALSLIVERDKDQIPNLLPRIANAGDVALFLGAGDIRKAAERYAGGGS